MIGVGRRAYPSLESLDLTHHRARAVSALRAKAHDDDDEARVLKHQLAEIDAAIKRGVASMPDDERRRFLTELYGAHAEHPDHECAPAGSVDLVDGIMTHHVITLNEEDNLADLEPSMAQFGLRHLPVVDGTRLVGLISHRDVLRMHGSDLGSNPLGDRVERQRRESTFVAEVMHREVSTVSPDTSVRDAAKILVAHKFGCLPVIDGDHNLVGIVTEHDIVAHFVKQGVDPVDADAAAS